MKIPAAFTQNNLQAPFSLAITVEKSTVTDPGSVGFTSVPGAGAGIGSASGHQASTTNSGISGATF